MRPPSRSSERRELALTLGLTALLLGAAGCGAVFIVTRQVEFLLLTGLLLVAFGALLTAARRA